jgi:hypothetical protein
MLLNKIIKTKNRFRAYPTRQAVQTTGSTASRSIISMQTQGLSKLQALNEQAKRAIHSRVFLHQVGKAVLSITPVRLPVNDFLNT